MSPIRNRRIDILYIFPSSHLSAGPFSVSASLSNVDRPARFPWCLRDILLSSSIAWLAALLLPAPKLWCFQTFCPQPSYFLILCAFSSGALLHAQCSTNTNTDGPNLWYFDITIFFFFSFMIVQKPSFRFWLWVFSQASDRWSSPSFRCWPEAGAAPGQPRDHQGNIAYCSVLELHERWHLVG